MFDLIVTGGCLVTFAGSRGSFGKLRCASSALMAMCVATVVAAGSKLMRNYLSLNGRMLSFPDI